MEIWSLEHREAQHSQDSLDVLAAKYAHDLIEERVSLRELTAACSKASRRWQFFPKMADIMKAVDEHRLNPPCHRYDQAQLGDTTSYHDLTPEEVARNLERIEAIKLVFSPDPEKRLSVEEAVAFVESKNHIEEFRAR